MFSNGFVNSIRGHEAAATPVQSYLYEPENPFASAMSDPYPGNDTTPIVSNDAYAARLGLQLNTYWNLINGNVRNSWRQGVRRQPLWQARICPPVIPGSTFLANSSTTTGTQTTSTPVIQAHDGWVAALSIASLVMSLASLVPPIIRYGFTRSPGVMLNFSGLATRNNPVHGAAGQRNIHGPIRARQATEKLEGQVWRC